MGTISHRSAEERVTGAPARTAGELAGAYWRAWAPLFARMAATGLALLGLAGIGWAARGSGELAALSTAPLSFGLAQLAGPGIPAAIPASVAPPAPQPPAPCARGAPAPERPAPPEPPAATGRALTAEGRVILNLAGPVELQRLPGVGAKRAVAIVALRERLGRFRRLGDLLRIKGIGPRTLERMLPMLVLDADPKS